MREEASKPRRTFDDWYGENADEVKAKKKARYANDGDYRRKAKARSRQQYREANGILKNDSRIVRVNGARYVAWRVAEAATILKIHAALLRSYFSQGFLPEMKFDGTNLRMVTVEQITLIRHFLKEAKKIGATKAASKLNNHLIKHWRDRDGSKEVIRQEK